MLTMSETRSPRARIRAWATALVVVLTAVSLLGATFLTWATRSVLDTDRVANAVERGLEDPQVTDALGGYLADQVQPAIVESGVLTRLLPDRLDRLEPLLAASLRNVIVHEANRLLASPRARAVLVESVRLSHAAALRVLDGEPPRSRFLVVGKGTVTLNLVPLVDQLLRRVQQLGLLQDVVLPDIETARTPAEEIALLSQALGHPLPRHFAQLTVYRNDAGNAGSAINTAQRILAALRSIVWLIWLLTIALGVLAIALARNRAQTLLWLGISAAATGVLAHVIVRKVERAVAQLVSDPTGRAATARIVGRAVDQFDRIVVVLTMGFGIALAAAAVALSLRERDGATKNAPVSPGDALRVGAVGVSLAVVAWLGLSYATASVGALLVAGAFAVTRRTLGPDTTTTPGATKIRQ